MKKLPILAVTFLFVTALQAQIIPERSTTITKNPTTERSVMRDIDGNVYRTVTLGRQTWTAENLKVTKLNDGTPIELAYGSTWGPISATDVTPKYCFYNPYGENYGALYNWYTVNTKKLCPTGWHVPFDREWSTLLEFLMANGYTWKTAPTLKLNYLGKALSSTTGWEYIKYTGSVGDPDYPEYRNKSGFTGFPGGKINIGGSAVGLGQNAWWWTSTESADNKVSAWFMVINYNGSSIATYTDQKWVGLSVRCLKDY